MADPLAVAAVLGSIAKNVIETILFVGTEKIAEGTLEKLRGDQAKNAFAQALVVRLKSNLT